MFKSLIVAGTLTAFCAMAGGAFAQSGDCTCVTAAPTGSAVGFVSLIRGQVLSSQESGLSPVTEGSGIPLGSQIVTGPNSSASLDVGSCAISVAPNSEVAIAGFGADICVQVSEAGVVYPGQIPQITNVSLLMFGAAVAGSAVGSAIGGGDDAVSP